MNTFDPSIFFSILPPRQGPHVSLYMPTHRATKDKAEDIIRFKNLLRTTETLLQEMPASCEFLETFMKQAHVLIEDKTFWQSTDTGLVIFACPGEFQYYHLPINTPECVFVRENFQIKPLLPLLSFDEHFYIVLITKAENEFYRIEGRKEQLIKLPHCPKNLEELSQYDVHERHIEFHTKTQPVSGNMRAAMFHGQGDGQRELVAEEKLYVKNIADSISKYIGDDKAPVILVADPIIAGFYRQERKHQNVLTEFIHGSFSKLDKKSLFENARKLANSYSQSTKKEELERIFNGSGEQIKNLISTDIKAILENAHQGKIRTLFLNPAFSKWGHYDKDKGQIRLHVEKSQGNDDLFELAARWTLEHRGSIVPISEEYAYAKDGIIALFRY